MADRFARQIALAEIGEAGQRAIERSTARVPKGGLGGEIARAYAERAGFAGVVEDGPLPDVPSFVTTPAARAVVAGSLAALASLRAVLGREDE